METFKVLCFYIATDIVYLEISEIANCSNREAPTSNPSTKF